MGYRIHVITDHQALEFFKTQAHLTGRQMRWMDYMSRFDFDITYIKGENNKVADCLSRYYENDTWDEAHNVHEYVRADARVDPGGEDLPPDRYQELQDKTVEVHAMHEANLRRSQRLQERQELQDIEAQELAIPDEQPSEHQNVEGSSKGRAAPKEGTGMTIEDMLKAGPTIAPIHIDDDCFLETIKRGYEDDSFFKMIVEDPTANQAFEVKDGLVWMKNNRGDLVLCIPQGVHNSRSLQEVVLEQAHRTLGHYGYQHTSEYARRWYWWPRIVSDAREFCKTCGVCQQAKGSMQLPPGKLHTLPVLTKPWESIGMDFVGPFPEVEVDGRKLNYLWVVVCRMTSMVHLIPVHTKMTASQLSGIYMREVVRLHGLPKSIVSDRDPKFTSKWWRELHRMLGAKLLMSTSFHPQTDGMTERMN